jgi:uncharacterized protein (TIGR02246 family)
MPHLGDAPAADLPANVPEHPVQRALRDVRRRAAQPREDLAGEVRGARASPTVSFRPRRSLYRWTRNWRDADVAPSERKAMPDDEQQIRTLIERWAEAAHTGDIDTVLAAHADDIVMFDVPPPHDGVRGIDAYRKTWPPFFEWQASGASFEIVELDVAVGDDVAYAHALLRCGSKQELAEHPERRLRLTIGLRRENGGWVVAHEHHSFADETP